MRLPRLILASASPRRAQLMRDMGLEFQVVPGLAEELHPEHLTPGEICQINAHRKARSVARRHPEALVIGADTIVCLEDEIFGKPENLEEAVEMLQRLQGRTHWVLTGVCLLHQVVHRQKSFAVGTAVKFRRLNAAQIRRYVSTVDPLDKAGAYGIQEKGEQIIENVAGSFSNVVGLPVERLTEELQRWSAALDQ